MENTVKQGKIFVGGISWETTEETLKKHFSRYGEVVKSEIPKVWETGFGKGFGFVTFTDSSVFDKLLQDQHIILGRTVDVSLARPKGEKSQSQRCSECQQTSKSHRKKIFVGGLPQYLSEKDFKQYFERFGRIEDAKIIYDRETNTPRGFGFITYDSEEAVTNVLQRRFHMLNNKFVEIKKAMPKEKRVMDTCTYSSYPTNSGYVLVPVLNTNEIYAPNYNYYLVNPAMVPRQSFPFNYSDTNISVSQPAQIQCYTPRHPVNYYASTPNGVDNGGSYEALSNTPRCPVNCYASAPNGVDNKGSNETLPNAARCPVNCYGSTPNGVQKSDSYEALSNEPRCQVNCNASSPNGVQKSDSYEALSNAPRCQVNCNASTPNGVQKSDSYEALSNAPRCQVNCYASASNGVDNGGSYKALSNGAYNSDVENQIDVKCSNDSDCGSDKSVSHEGNHQDCNIEVQLAGNVSPRGKSGLFSIGFNCEFNYSVIKSLKNNITAPRSKKSLEKEADNGEKDNNGKNSQVNKEADHGKTDQSLKNSQVNSVAENGVKDYNVKNSQVNAEADNGKDQSETNSQVNTEHDTLLEMNGVSSK
uniref:RRM domain-containing protein n=1 Tax=Nicotiana tabacum TaxID=4097 RepID=A0A1S3X4N4_TOBAC|nr:PREDICTED: uncharacterized protein LOC107761128 [Nicotiana tabacum]